MLIEGITEALLLPLIAKYYVFSEETAENKSNLMKFLSMPLIPIDGVDFKPYVKVLLSRQEGNCICDQVIVITDLDPAVPGNRKEDLEALALELNSSENIEVFENSDTLESELYMAENSEILKSVYLELHPRSLQNWADQIDTADEALRPQAFIDLLKKSNTRKGDFAQLLASRITDINDQENDEQDEEENREVALTFSPPQYLINAIQAVVA